MLKGMSAMITGSVGDIGFAAARALAEQGADITLNGFAAPEALEVRLAELRRLGVRARHHDADLRDPAQIAALVSSTREAHGGVDIVVNNAVVRYFGAVEDFAPAHWDEALAVNLSAPFHLIQLALPGLKQRNWGGSSTWRLSTGCSRR